MWPVSSLTRFGGRGQAHAQECVRPFTGHTMGACLSAPNPDEAEAEAEAEAARRCSFLSTVSVWAPEEEASEAPSTAAWKG